MIKFYTEKNYDSMSRRAADIIAAQIILKPESVLGLATGSSPLGLYKCLIKMYNEEILDFSRIATINLDEYRGLTHEHNQSYYYFMNENLFSHINIDRNFTHVPDGSEKDAAKACKAYDDIIEGYGGIDIQLLGIGHNGHIGFNEPASCFSKGTQCVDLAESTINANSRFFEKKEDVPKQAYTMGIGSIMKAKKILLIASGEAKAEIIKKAFTGDITPEVPASVLQLHPDVTVVGDEAAMSLL